MSTYIPLINELGAWFDTPLCELPTNLQTRVLSDFFPEPWDSLSPNQRRSVAAQMDYQQDPATEADRKYWWDFFERQGALERRISEWERVATPTASELLRKETQLAELCRELARMADEERKGRVDNVATESDDERCKPVGRTCPPAISADISQHFRVIHDPIQNEIWWKTRMRDAKRNGLSKCRIGEGKKGPGGSLWRPDLVAAWLVERWDKKKQGLSNDKTRTALMKFPGCQEIAETMFASDE
jgi:hypothetical protein